MIRSLVLALVMIISAFADLAAQQRRETADTTLRLPRAQATRAELESELAAERSGANRETVINALQHRLEEGDIRSGDRIVVQVQGEAELTDTFTVRSDRTLNLPTMAPIPMGGLLRSEVAEKVTAEIARYIREPVVYVEPLMRVAVLGPVGKPGYYTVRADMPLPELIMTAGGPTGEAALDKTKVQRTGQVVRTSDEIEVALATSTSLDEMNLQSGDEIIVGEKGSGFMKTLQYIAPLTGIVYLVTRIF